MILLRSFMWVELHSLRRPLWIVVRGRPAPFRDWISVPPSRVVSAGMSRYSVAQEIMLGGADYLVELRGFEPRCSG
jgi:hypothetical protein